MFIPVADGARAVTVYHQDTNVWTNTYWFTKFMWENSDLTNLAVAIDSTIHDTWITHLSNDVNYDFTRVYGMRTVADPVVVSAAGAGAGGQSDDMMPLDDALVATLRTGNRGRSARGRLYISGLGKAQFTNGQFVSGAVTDLDAMLSYIMSSTAALGWTWCVVSFQENGVVRSSGLARPVTAYEVRSRIPGTVHTRDHRP